MLTTDLSRVVCFGELLWDCLPAGLFLGGAPANVAYHLARNGVASSVASAVGDDFLGHEAVRRVWRGGSATDLIALIADSPTGVVQVDAAGSEPHYTIVDDAAWDRIPLTPALADAASEAPAIVFGTLSLRHAPNRETLDRMLAKSPALKALDINLRPPFVAPEVIAFAASRADLLKLNDEEASFGEAPSGDREPDALLRRAEQWASKYSLETVCITAGARGAGLWRRGEWLWEDGRPVAVRDAVGAGDAFLAGLLASLLAGSTAALALRRACRLGELTASRDGATPEYDASEIAS